MWTNGGPCFIIPLFYGYKHIQYTEPVSLKYGQLATKYPWIYGYFYSAVSEEHRSELGDVKECSHRSSYHTLYGLRPHLR